MANISNEPGINDRRNVTLILRLGLEQDGELIDGELLDTIGSLSRRFKKREGLNQASIAWFKETTRLFGAPNDA